MCVKSDVSCIYSISWHHRSQIGLINCIKSLRVHGLDQDFSENASLPYGMNCLSPLLLAQLVTRSVILNADFSDYLVCF